MDIKSVTSGVNSFAATPSVQTEQTQQTQQAQQARQAQAVEQRVADQRAERKEQAQRPVVNAEGQTTGTVINVTA